LPVTPPPLPATPPPLPATPPPLPATPADPLVDGMRDLAQQGSASDGARLCLRVAASAVPSLAGLVHLRDPKTLDLVLVHAQGPRAEGLLRTRTPQGDSLVVRAARAGKPIVATYGAEPDAEKVKCPRHAYFDPWSVLIVPVMMRGGQLLGLLEMIDPYSGNPSDEKAQAALASIADRLARFLAEHPAEPMAP
jgi:GAF domain-containing protein